MGYCWGATLPNVLKLPRLWLKKVCFRCYMKDRRSRPLTEAACEGLRSNMYVTNVCTKATTFGVRKCFKHEARKGEALKTCAAKKKEKRR
jgi:hypothetical protein